MIYVIYDMADVTNINFSEVYENSEDTLRLSLDGSKTVLKFTGNTPTFLVGLTQYNHTEIKQIMQSSEWVTND